VHDEDRYLFDLQGYLSVQEALAPEVVADLNATLDRMAEQELDPVATTHRYGDLLARGPVFRDLIDNARVLPTVTELLGANLRLDHEYADIIRSGLGPIGARLHGGATPFRPGEFYWSGDGILHSGLLVVAYNLRDVGPEDGGFACVPGSHKSAFPFPDAWKQLSSPHPTVRKVTGPAGSAIIFTEALVHGTLPWRGHDERRTLFYKYNPGPLAWSRKYYDPSDYPDLTDQQRALLKSPGVAPSVQYP
jgi:ectoine hydroxylase-related dioxygenase (phytanoyl-CoA dioxygenase family)